MGSLYGPDDRSPEDLTARARIRDAALVQFAEHGVKGATMKSIAEAAGVSTGLVQHHFGSKEELRRACDEAVVEVFRRRLARSVDTDEITKPDFMAALYETSAPLTRYLARAAVDGTSAAASVLDELAAGAEEFLTSTWPDRFPPGSRQARDSAAVMSAMHGGVIVLHEHLARQMGVDPLEGADSTRIGMAMFDVYTAMGEFATSETGNRIKDTVTRYRDRTQNSAAPSDKEHDDARHA